MKHFNIILAILLIFPTVTFGQKNIDILLARLSNDQLLIACYNTQSYLDTYSQDVKALIKIGKPVTKKVTQLLADPNKGIIAHYVLTRIWKEKGFKPLKYSIDVNGIGIIDFHGLTFIKDRSGHFSAKQSDIELNKNNWTAKLPKHYR